jgi:hypothetical protein
MTLAAAAFASLLSVLAVAQAGGPPSPPAEAFVRQRPGGEHSLMLVLSLANQGKVDEVRVSLDDDDEVAAASAPDGWSHTQNGKRLRASGPAIAGVHLRFDVGSRGARLAGKRLAIQAFFERQKVFDGRVTVAALPPAAIASSLEDVLWVPERAVTGQPLLAMPGEAYRDGTWTLITPDTTIPFEPFTDVPQGVTLPGDPPLIATLPPGEGFRIVYFDRWNERLVDAPLGATILPPAACEPTLASGAEFAFAGQGACVSGCFPDPAAWYGLRLDGQHPLLPVAASPTTLLLAIPPEAAAGPHTIQWGDGIAGQGTVRVGVLQVEGTIDQNLLWRGQSTTMRLRVLGTDRPLPIVITNRTPGGIAIEGGDAQTVDTSGGADNALTRSVRGIQKGNFQIDYALHQPGCGAP